MPQDPAELLRDQINKGQHLLTLSYDNSQFPAWRDETIRIVAEIFQEDSSQVNQFRGFFPNSAVGGLSDARYQVIYANRIERVLLALQSYIGDLARIPPIKAEKEVSTHATSASALVASKSADEVPNKNKLIVIALIIAVLFAPTPFQSIIVGYFNNPSSSQTQPLFPVAATLQSICTSGSNPCSSAVLSLATGLGVGYTYSQNLTIRNNPQIAIKSSNIASGTNVTFVVKSWAGAKTSQLSNFMLHVFVIDPEGTVEAEFPQGDTVNIVSHSGGSSTFQFYPPGNQLYNSFGDNFAANGIRFTMPIPSDSLSVGTWRIVVFATGVSPSVSNAISGANTASFTVFSSSLLSSLTQGVFGLFGITGAVYTGEKYLLGQEKLAGSAGQFVRKNWFGILSIVLLAIFILSIYFPF